MSQRSEMTCQRSSPEPAEQRSCCFVSSERHKGFASPVLTGTYFTVKSADSGIQNSADGSREVLTDVAADNNLPEAGRKLSDVTSSQIRMRSCIFLVINWIFLLFSRS